MNDIVPTELIAFLVGVIFCGAVSWALDWPPSRRRLKSQIARLERSLNDEHTNYCRLRRTYWTVCDMLNTLQESHDQLMDTANQNLPDGHSLRDLQLTRPEGRRDRGADRDSSPNTDFPLEGATEADPPIRTMFPPVMRHFEPPQLLRIDQSSLPGRNPQPTEDQPTEDHPSATRAVVAPTGGEKRRIDLSDDTTTEPGCKTSSNNS